MAGKIAVLLPGTTGTRLLGLDGLSIVWPDAVMAEAALGGQAAAAKLLEDNSLQVGEPGGWRTGNGYGSFKEYFAQRGFQTVAVTAADAGTSLPGLPADGDLLVGFGYDWRKDVCVVGPSGGTITGIAADLHQVLAAIDAAYGQDGYELYLIGHSMGGLVARAYLENAAAAGYDVSKVQALVTLGTPHLGAPVALAGIMGTLPLPSLLSFAETLVEDFVNNSYSDSTYELLPPPPVKFISSGSASYSVFDAGAPLPPQVNSGNLAEAAAFQGMLGSGSLPASVPCHCIYGIAGQPTYTGFTFGGGTWTPVSTAGAGDFVVPASSAMWTDVAEQWQVPGSVTHFQLPGNALVQQKVAQIMGVAQAVNVPAAAAVAG